MLVAIMISGVCKAELSTTEISSIRNALAGDIPGLIARFQLADALDREGIGRSDAKTSGGLGWGESRYLHHYMMCYTVTEDTYWFDKIIDHFDRVINTLSDHDEDGLLSWQDMAYSVGLVDIEAEGPVGDLTLATPNGDRRVYVKRGVELITGHQYRLRFLTDTRAAVSDLTTGKTLGEFDYVAPAVVELVPGTKLRLNGTGRADAQFKINTQAPELCEYQVHDGMVTYPIALFIEHVRTTPAVGERYVAKAQAYLQLLHRHFIMRWERTWIDLPPDAGVYAFTDNPTQRFPGYSLPHNQYLAPARTCLVLGSLTGYEEAELCAERARKMASYFHRNLRLTDEGAYVWYYWDPLPGEHYKRHIEDEGHGTIDIGFAVAAAKRDVVFGPGDLARLARTYVDVMWDGDRQNPRFGKRVDTNEGDRAAWWEWVQLAVADYQVWELGLAAFERSRRATTMIPSMCWLYARTAGMSETDRDLCRANSAKVRELTDAPGLINPSFEVQAPSSDGPAGWRLGIWNPDKSSSAEWVDDAHDGSKAILLTGKGDPVNVWAQNDRTLKVSPPAKLTIAAFYKADEGARPTISVLAHDASGTRVQYNTSPPFAATAEWKPASWEIDINKDARTVSILLRNHAPGRVFWDQAAVEFR
jgi:hypothetical protein